ncbi:outer membrane beta-barrel protein, partial [bacterium]|nr:outer membrane beta-barrel protein [bacterium]
SHSGDINAQITLGEGHDIRVRSNFSVSNSSLSNLSFQESRDGTGKPKNSADTQRFNDGDRVQGSGQLTWRKKLNDKGRSLILFSSADLNDSDTSTDLTSTIGTFDPLTDLLTYDELAQLQSTIGNQLTQRHRLSLIEPIGKANLELQIERQLQDQDETKNFSDIVAGTPVLNELLSGEFNRTYSYWNGSAQISKTTEDQFLSFTLKVQKSDLEGRIVNRSIDVSNGYTHVLPSIYFRRSLGTAANIQLRYSTDTREPSINELQPFVDNSNPLSVFIGNPDLEPQYTHSMYSDYRFFDQYTFVNVYASIWSSWTRDQIVQSRTIDEQLRQTFTNVNSGDGFSHNARASFGTPIRKLGIQIDLSNSLSWSTGTQFINGDENKSRILRYSPSLTVQNRFRDVFEVRGTYSLTYNDVNYSLNKEQNRQYANSSVRFSGDLFQGGWTFGTAVDFRIYDQKAFGGADNRALIEATIGKLLPNEKTEIQLIVRDVLNQNQGISYTNSNNYIQEDRVETLGRYMMLKVTHKLSKGASPQGRGRR